MTGNDAQDRDIWLGLGLAEAASEAKVGPVPMADIMAGGRRIRHRRRTVVGALALASAVALGGGALAQLHPAPVASAAGGGPGTATALGPASAPTEAATPAAKDPLQPRRVLLLEGVTDGRSWKVWRAVWPLAPKDRAFEQAMAVYRERVAFDPTVTKPTEEYVGRYWQSDRDVVNDYVEVDGVRVRRDAEGALPAAGHLPPEAMVQTTFGGGLLGHRGKDDPGTGYPTEIGMVGLGPVVDRVSVTWDDGTKTEPKPVTIGDSPIREIVMAKPVGKRIVLWEFFDRDGRKLPNDGTTLFTERG